jgi:hypothetical protein
MSIFVEPVAGRLRAAECDHECSRIDGSRPDTENRRLRGVELTARGVEGLLQPDVYIAEMLRLPFFWRDSGPIYAWPPPTPPLLAPSFVLAGPNPDWQDEIKARNAAQREESERVIAHYRERDRERRERELRRAKRQSLGRSPSATDVRDGRTNLGNARAAFCALMSAIGQGDIRASERSAK